MSIYYDLDPITEGIEIERQPMPSCDQQANMKKQPHFTHDQLSPEAQQILLLQNQNQEMRQMLTKKKQQLAWLSLKSINIGKEFMKLTKERDSLQEVVSKAAAKLQKYKNKNASLEQKLKIFKVQNQSIKELSSYDKQSTISNYQKASKNLDKILDLIKNNPELKNVQDLLLQTKQIIQP